MEAACIHVRITEAAAEHTASILRCSNARRVPAALVVCLEHDRLALGNHVEGVARFAWVVALLEDQRTVIELQRLRLVTEQTG